MNVGIIATAHEVPRVASLLRHLGQRASVTLHVDEETLVDSRDTAFDEDVIFTKGRGYGLLTMARIAEEQGVRVVNGAHATWLATHRLLCGLACRQAGVRVPDFALGTTVPASFERTIVKNVVDHHHLRFLDVLPIVAGPGDALPPIATAEEAGDDERVPHFHYFQRFLRTRYEHKVYVVGDRQWHFRQTPVLVNPDKMATRVRIDPVPELEEAAKRVARATGLAIASLDFLEEDGHYYLTDVNCTPNFNYLEDGAAIVGDWLLSLAR
ncbi:MAG: hypothetical protein U1F54_09480 [Burkholderiales bacterium]